MARDVVVVAASAGGLEGLMRLLRALPAAVPAGIAAVVHRNRFADGQLREVLQGCSSLPVVEPESGVPFEHGRVYLAPRDHHLMLAHGAFQRSRGLPLHHLRPAADALFTTAASACGPRVLAVVLSGGGFDGAAGCLAISRQGGMAIVQAPGEAHFPFMPRHAISADHVEAALPLARMAEAIATLARGEPLDLGG